MAKYIVLENALNRQQQKYVKNVKKNIEFLLRSGKTLDFAQNPVPKVEKIIIFLAKPDQQKVLNLGLLV
jgi:hypothetical protein